jgi:predicted RNA-binding Zn ribbon-like protein
VTTAASPSPTPAPGEERSIALALVNTELSPGGDPLDLLAQPSDLVRWLGARQVRRRSRAAATDADLARVYDLRAAIRTVFAARVGRARPSRPAVDQINHAAAAAPAASRLSWTADGPKVSIARPERKSWLDPILAEIAEDAVQTLLGDRGERLRICEAHGCNRMFIQDHRRRRWCSRACGDRVRFARHYRRTHVTDVHMPR